MGTGPAYPGAMMYFSRLKTGLILAVCVLGAWFCLPNLVKAPAPWLPWRQIHLGLDLRGGSYLLLEVDMAAVVRERLDALTDSARQTLLRSESGGYLNLAAQPAQRAVTLRLRDPSRADRALAALRGLDGNGTEFDVDAQADGQVSLTLRAEALRARSIAAVQQSIEIVRRRIDQTGVVDPQIARQGDNRLIVELPGVEDPNRIKELLGQTAHMTFRLVDESANPETPPPGEDALPLENSPRKIVVRRRIDVDGADLTNARVGVDQQGRPAVNFTFNAAGTRAFAEISRNNVGHLFAIVLDNKVISAPVINSPIPDGHGQISGGMDEQRAEDLAVLLRAGALPAPLTVVEERSVGPELGADSIRAGTIALAVGFVLVIGFMAAFYGLFGWYANMALVANLILQLAALSLLQATLTLPGMAGILLTLGMAVDANILINERIREEYKNGRTPLAAMEAGFKRAYATIIDSQVTALLAHVMLFAFGTGPVRGFAVTITIGIATTMFTAILLARMLMVRWYVGRRPAALPV